MVTQHVSQEYSQNEPDIYTLSSCGLELPAASLPALSLADSFWMRITLLEKTHRATGGGSSSELVVL